MKSKRRTFIQTLGLSGIVAMSPLRSQAFNEKTEDSLDKYKKSIDKIEKKHVQRFNMSGYAAPPIDNVRVGIIGLGNRGPTYIKTMGPLKGVQIKALAELRPEKARQAEKKQR